jgi:hypothetical protein
MRRVRSSSNGQIELNLRFSCAIETMSHQHIILPPQLLPLLLTAAVESHRWLEASTIEAVKTHTHNWATGDVRKNRDFLWLWNHYQYPTWKPL